MPDTVSLLWTYILSQVMLNGYTQYLLSVASSKISSNLKGNTNSDIALYILKVIINSYSY